MNNYNEKIYKQANINYWYNRRMEYYKRHPYACPHCYEAAMQGSYKCSYCRRNC